MKQKEIPSQKYLQECFEIRSNTLYWKLRPDTHKISTGWNLRRAHTQVIGREAGVGYQQLRLNMVSYKIHRIVYKLVHGNCPDLIDHIDCNRQNNSPSNLRAATHSTNKFNRYKQSNNTSGYKGVIWHKQNKNWVAQITHFGKHIHVGSYPSPQQAHTAYINKAQKLVGAFAKGG